MTIAGATYFNTGSNLFDDDNGYPYHGANREMIISKEEKADEVKRFVSARRALTKIYFQRLWRSNN